MSGRCERVGLSCNCRKGERFKARFELDHGKLNCVNTFVGFLGSFGDNVLIRALDFVDSSLCLRFELDR